MSVSSVGIEDLLGKAEAAQTKDLYQPNDDLNKTAFLNLLVTQLKYQDPMNPTDNQQFAAQMAQFSALEQMQNLNASFESFNEIQSLTQISSLIGKKITALNADTGEFVTGTVESAIMYDGEYFALVNGLCMPVENIIKVEPATTTNS